MNLFCVYLEADVFKSIYWLGVYSIFVVDKLVNFDPRFQGPAGPLNPQC